MKASGLTEHLASLGAIIYIGQKADNITDDIDLVVYTAAIHQDNPEFAAGKEKGIPMMSRAALLGQIMANYLRSIAVAGTHGKTTTTSMLTHILLQGDLDPTVSVGGMLDRIGGNIRVGQSDVFPDGSLRVYQQLSGVLPALFHYLKYRRRSYGFL